MFLILGFIMLFFAITTNGVSLNPRNFTFILIQNSYILILAAGMVLVIIVGNIDLSVGSVAAFTGAISAILFNSGVPFPLTVLITIGIGLVIGAYQGFWIAYQKIPAFIVTLSGYLLFRGLTYMITNVTPITPRTDIFKILASGTIEITKIVMQNGEEVVVTLPITYIIPIVLGILVAVFIIFISFNTRRSRIKNGFNTLPVSYFIIKLVFLAGIVILLCVQFAQYRGLPYIFLILGLTVAIFSFITKNTVFGRYIYAVGGNSKSAKLSGINSEKIVFLVHTIMGGLCGLSGIIFTGFMNSALPDAGFLFELDAIAACFIGGASASGGIGTIVGAIMGGLVMGIINNGMSLMNLGAKDQYVVKGVVLLLAVWYDVYTRKKSGLS
ncbi:MAG: sugar ABC transporter permease [Spirochaetales bacterium]|nr:sugar ABC transporter permease [Spirochaetales bacterium]